MDLNTLLRTQWDRAAAIGCTVLGALLLLLGWVGVSGTAYVAEQIPYLTSGGIGGLFLLAVGATLWVSADLRDEWRKLDRIEEALAGGVLRWEDTSPVAVVESAPEVLLAPAPDVIESPRVAARTVNGSSRRTAAKAPAKPTGKPRVRATATTANDA